jgi:hypothetical protein
LILQTGKALFAKSSPPLPDDLRAHLKPTGDLHVRQPRGRVEHDLRALNVPIRQRQLRSPPLQLEPLLLAERDLHRRRHRHQDSPAAL